MQLAIDIGLTIAAIVIALPLAVFAVECFLSLLPALAAVALEGPRPRAVVLVPAHNEEGGIAATVRSILAELGPDDRVLVVADNCTDATARMAAEAGAEVAERQDATRRGKGFALAHGVARLAESNPPNVVLVLDADCRFGPGSVERLARAAVAHDRPAQALNLCDPGPDADPLQLVSGLGIRFRNQIRPTGLARLGFPCHLMGTGMAIPWRLIAGAQLASGNLVEDMQLGLDLALAGNTTQFVPEARVDSPLPSNDQAFVSQRTRWEHGHLATLLRQAPWLLLAGLTRFRLDLLAMALDLLVPPLAFLGVAWVMSMTCLAIAWWFGASWLPLAILGGVGGAAFLAAIAAWWVWCRETIPATALALVPWYLLRKVPIYLAFFFQPQSQWVRTEREAKS